MKDPDKLGITDKLLLCLIGSVVCIAGGAVVASAVPLIRTGFSYMLIGFGICSVVAGIALLYQAVRG